MTAARSSHRPRLVLVPGLGVDGRLFEPQRAVLPDLLVPEWPSPEPRESLAHYAARMAAAVKAAESGPVVVGGVSFGGMLALEMSQHLDTRAVALIASCRSPRGVCLPLRFAEYPARVLPSALVSWSRVFAPLVVGRGGVPREHRAMLIEMIRGVSVPLLRWGARAIMEWPGRDELAVPVHHIHGDRDWVIPVAGVKPTQVVHGGAHVLNLSHPDEVNGFLRKACCGNNREEP